MCAYLISALISSIPSENPENTEHINSPGKPSQPNVSPTVDG